MLRLRGLRQARGAKPDAEDRSPPTRSFARELMPVAGGQPHSVTKLLYDRLSEADIAEVERGIAETPGAERFVTALADPSERRRLVLCFGMWLGVASVGEKTGLRSVNPPDDVHAMARGPLAAAGGLYEADMVIDTVIGAGMQVEDIASGLDFGCSSGRVVSVLAAAYPHIRWAGCDPNDRAIAWASDNLPGIEFFVSNQRPPVPLTDGSLDLAFAISIWSHFAPELGLDWFEEMRRLIRPGGMLVCTTHGLTSVGYYEATGLRSSSQLEEISADLYRRGWWYAAEFGRKGDWGVVNPSWGTSFLAPEWMLTNLCPQWRVLEFVPGRNQDNQDIYVLQRT